MVIINVSNSKENAMLNTVRVLRRLLRNAFFVTNRVNVISELQRGPEAGRRRQARPSPPRIDEEPRYLQPVQVRFPQLSRLPACENDLLRVLYFRASLPPTSGDRHQGRMTIVTQPRHNNYNRRQAHKVTLILRKECEWRVKTSPCVVVEAFVIRGRLRPGTHRLHTPSGNCLRQSVG